MEKRTNAIIYDLDGTLCTKRKSGETYKDVQPIQSMVDQLNKFYDEGHTIIINTARNMATQNNDVGKVMQNIGELTLRWLREHNIRYHSIVFGKPYGMCYCDDRSVLNCPNEIERRVNAVKNGNEQDYIGEQKRFLNNKDLILSFLEKSVNEEFNIDEAKKILNNLKGE